MRTSLGPRGMDKMIVSSDGKVTITNDGATIVRTMELQAPCAKMMAETAHAQDVEAGDGTTTVTVLTGELLHSCEGLLHRGIHPAAIVEGFHAASLRAQEIVRAMSTPVAAEGSPSEREALVQCAQIALASKVVAQHGALLAPLAVDAVLRVAEKGARDVDLKDVRVVSMVGGTVEDTELVPGLVLTQHASHAAGGPGKVTAAKIGLIQFQLSAPKTNMENAIVVDNYAMLDRLLKQERAHVLEMVKTVKATGCNVLLVQKSILRDAVSDLALAYLAKLKIMLIKDIERDDIEFLSKALGAIPIASIEAFTADKLGSCQAVEELSTPGGKVVKLLGLPQPRYTTVFVRGSNPLVVAEAERSLHDALCVVRSLVKERRVLVGGAAPEIEVALQLAAEAHARPGLEGAVWRAYASAFEVIPYTLAENAGLHPIQLVTELRTRHAQGQKTMGINARTGTVADMAAEQVLQPLLVTLSAIRLATDTVTMIMKIDDIILVR